MIMNWCFAKITENVGNRILQEQERCHKTRRTKIVSCRLADRNFIYYESKKDSTTRTSSFAVPASVQTQVEIDGRPRYSSRGATVWTVKMEQKWERPFGKQWHRLNKKELLK